MTSICEKPPSSVAALLDVNGSLYRDHPLLEAFPYRVQTKYFTADINLYACADPSELSDAELSQFEALVVLFDANCDNFKEKVEYSFGLIEHIMRLMLINLYFPMTTR